MNDLLKIAVIALVASFIGGYIGGLVGNNQPDLSGVTNYDILDVTDGYRVDGTTVIDGDGNVDGVITSSTGSFSSTLIVNGLFTYSPTATATTTTGASATLVENDLLSVGYHVITPGDLAEGADFTYTLPATTTLSTFLSGVGERAEVCWFMTATTSDSNIIFAAGTGIDLRFASSTVTGQAVPGLQFGSEQDMCLKFMRQPKGNSVSSPGDMTAIIEIYEAND